MMTRRRKEAALLAGTAVLAFGPSGCGKGVTAPANSTPALISVASAHGLVMGGQQPIAGVTLQLYQAGTTGYGSAATPLGPSVQTYPSGNFDLPSYTCAAGSQVYLVGTGGQPIAAASGSPAVSNNNLSMMVGLGTCGGTDLSTFIDLNELTTVATIWAVSPFMTGAANIGTTSTNPVGLANAFSVINQVVNTANGKISGPTLPAGATLPINEINTLADILEQCVNSAGGVAGDSSGCGNFFKLAPNSGGTVYPTDTITAAMNVAQNPGRNVAQLNTLRSASPVFQPAFSVYSPPNDWNIAITYSSAGLSAPSSIAADTTGAIWVSNKGNASVTKLDYTGTVVAQTSGSLNSPTAIAIDNGGNAWVTNANNTITKISPTASSTTSYNNNGLSAPGSIAIDGAGNIWVGNTTGSDALSAFSGSGGALAGSPFSAVGTSAPVSIAITPK